MLILLMDFIEKEVLWPTFLWPAVAVAGAIGVLLSQQQPIPVMTLLVCYTAGTFFLASLWHRAAVWDSLSAIVPPFLGMLLTFGVLTVIGMPLNPANLIILPLIIGIGVDNGVHVLHDFHSKPHEIYSPSASLVNAITMTASTSIVGFGSMMISAHRGLYSLGAVLSIGVICCVFLALVTLPAFLAWFSRHRQPPAQVTAPPVEVRDEEPARILPLNKTIRVA
jgi:predicted RND superfamily exporter protein